MSKDIVIINNGVQETWQDIEYLSVYSTGVQQEDYMPEDETITAPLSVTQNGTYTAQGNVYGFSGATVNIPLQVTGTIDGTEYVITVDENGYLVYTPTE